VEQPVKKVYVPPSLEKGDRLVEVAEGTMVITTTGKVPF
jgi:hypothetical protein